jgi:hypothetical protein
MIMCINMTRAYAGQGVLRHKYRATAIGRLTSIPISLIN